MQDRRFGIMRNKKGTILLFALYTLFIFLVSLFAYLNIIPTKEISIPYYDLIGHFILYGIWGYLFALIFSKPIIIFRNFVFPYGIVFVSVITIAEEMLQSLSTVRTSSFSDLVCGMLGITIGMIFFNRRRGLTPQ